MGIPATIGVSASGLPPSGDQANAVISGTIAAVKPHKPFAFRGPMNIFIWAAINTALTTTAGSLAASVASATGLAAGNAIKSANVPKGTTIGALVGTAVTLALSDVTLQASGFSLVSNQITLPPGSNVSTLLGATVTVPSNAEGVTLSAGTTVTAVIQSDVAASQTAVGQSGIVRLSSAPTAVPPNANQQPLQFTLTGNAITATGADAAASFTGAGIQFNATVNIERSFDGGSTWLLANIGGGGTLAQYSLGPVSLTFGEPERHVMYRLNPVAYVAVAGTTINYRISETGAAAESLAVGPLI